MARPRLDIVVRCALVAGIASGCGRIGFDAISDPTQTSDATGDATGDAITIGTIAFVQAGPVVVIGSGPITVTLPAPSTAGTLLVATIATNSVSPIGLPASWTTAASVMTSGACAVALAFEANNPGNLTSFTFTVNGPMVGQVTEWSGVSATSPLDATGTQSGTSPSTSQPVQTTSSTLAAAELGVSVFCADVNMPTYTPESGWTNLGNHSDSSAFPSFTSDFALDLPIGVVSETQTSSRSAKYASALATFRP